MKKVYVSPEIDKIATFGDFMTISNENLDKGDNFFDYGEF